MGDSLGWGVLLVAGALELESDVDADDVLLPLDAAMTLRSTTSEADRLREAIVIDQNRHGVWLQLGQYDPLPKRIALVIASSWRRAKPELFGGDRHFRARIMPVTNEGLNHRVMTVRSETLYAVAVSYPHHAASD